MLSKLAMKYLSWKLRKSNLALKLIITSEGSQIKIDVKEPTLKK